MIAQRIIISNYEEIENARDLKSDLGLEGIDLPKEKQEYEMYGFNLDDVTHFAYSESKKTILLFFKQRIEEEIVAEPQLLNALIAQFSKDQVKVLQQTKK